MFGSLEWDDGSTFRVNGHRFTFVNDQDEQGVPEPPSDGFNLYKSRAMLDDYDVALAGAPPIERAVELGMFHGGSTALLAEVLRPERLDAFDIAPHSPSPHFDRYEAEHPALHAHWGVNQVDTAGILATIGDAPLDLVIDDASHYYDETVTSFDALFPRLRPGGIYVIEDWGWPFMPEWAEHPELRCQRSLSDIVLDLAALTVARPGVAVRVSVQSTLLAVVRGPVPVEDGALHLTGEPYRRSDWRANARRRSAERRVAGVAARLRPRRR